jgi:predicted transcriptional regulator
MSATTTEPATATPVTTRDAVIEMIRRMPADATADDIAAALYVRQAIDDGIRELDEGKGIPHEEIVRRVSKWLK